MDKVILDVDSSIADISPGASLAVGGFGLCGVPTFLIAALHRAGIGNLSVVSNNCGIDGVGLGLLLSEKRIRKMTSSYIGENAEFARQYLLGNLDLELVPQGTLAERLRAGGAGIPAFYTPAGVDTGVANGGIPIRYGPDGTTSILSTRKETREFGGKIFVLEHAIRCDFALVRARKADRFGNLVFHAAARNFNPLCAMAGAITIVESEEIVDPGHLDPDAVHLPGVFVQRVVPVPSDWQKPVERYVLREQEER